MSEAVLEALDSDASEAWPDAPGEGAADAAYEAYPAEAPFGEASSDDARRRRQRQIVAARQAQRRPSPAPARAARTTVAAAPGQGQAMAAIRDLNADTSAAVRALRRELEKARRKGDMASYSATLSVIASQALDTFEGNLDDHPLVRALVRTAPLGLLYGQGPQQGAAKFFGNPIVVGVAGVAVLLISGKLVSGAEGVQAVQISGPTTVGFGAATTNPTTIQLKAVAVNGKGQEMNVPLTWSSDDPTVATVDNNGNVTAASGAANGQSTWISAATSGGVSNRLLVTVTTA